MCINSKVEKYSFSSGMVILIIILTCTLSCTPGHNSQVFKFYTGNIKLSNDQTFIANLEMQESQKGTWRKQGNILILNSDYQADLLKDVSIIYSTSDTSKYSIVRVTKGNHTPYLVQLLLYENNSIDTVQFVKSLKEVVLISKSSSYNYFKILEQSQNIPKLQYATSSQYPIDKLTDSITISYNYPEQPLKYIFFNDDTFQIRNGILIEWKKAAND